MSLPQIAVAGSSFKPPDLCAVLLFLGELPLAMEVGSHVQGGHSREKDFRVELDE